MNRRGFLRGIGLGAASVAAAPLFKLLPVSDVGGMATVARNGATNFAALTRSQKLLWSHRTWADARVYGLTPFVRGVSP